MMRNILAALLLALPCSAATAGPRDDVVQGIVRCSTIPDDRQWLDCIYGAAQPMRAQLGLSPAPVAQQRLVPAQGYGSLPGYGGIPAPVAAAPLPVAPYAPLPRAPYASAAPAAPAQPQTQVLVKNDRGFVDRMLGTANIPTVVTRMQSYSFDGQGLFTVSLANGQTWRQVAESQDRARWNKPGSSYVVSIKPGAFGTFNLIINDEARMYKVRRVK